MYDLCLFTSTFHSCFLLFPLPQYYMKFVQRGFTERVPFEQRILAVDGGFTVI